jgi:hypothetical protein
MAMGCVKYWVISPSNDRSAPLPVIARLLCDWILVFKASVNWLLSDGFTMDALLGKVFTDTVFALAGMEAPLNE